MPGVWTQDQVGAATTRPGFYANFQVTALAAITGAGAGTVLLASTSDWGTPTAAGVEPVEFTTLGEVNTEFGIDTSLVTAQPAKLAAQMALTAGAPLVKFMMLATGSAAIATKTLADTTGAPINVIRLDAKKKGARGNEFKVTVAANAVDATLKDVKLYEQTTLLRTWTSFRRLF